VLWPLIQDAQRKDLHRLTVLPLGSWWAGRDGERRGFWTPLVGIENDGEIRNGNLALGLIGWSKGPKNRLSHYAFPLYHARHHEGYANFGLALDFLSDYSRDPAGRRYSIGWGMVGDSYWSNKDAAGLKTELREWIDAEIARQYERIEKEETKQLGPFHNSRTLRRHEWILSLFSNERRVDATAKPLDRDAESGPLAQTLTDSRGKRWTYAIAETGKASFLWRLYDSESKPQDDGQWSRRRVLWHLWRRETVGDRVAGDAFPFISWDQSPETGGWNFAGGLVGWRREGETGRLRLLWLPIG
jgi:hypothetical protein